MKILGIIPARMAATRFPNKSLAPICGMPMIGHVYLRSKLCKKLSNLYVATCDKEIDEYIRSIGGNVVMTKDTHERATDRTGEAFEKIINSTNESYAGVLMIQGDEPLLNPQLLDDMISFHINHNSASVTNLICEINDLDEFNNPNVVKVVKDTNDRILYFSRSPIPSSAKFNGEMPMWKQLGLILFSSNAIMTYVNLRPTVLEKIESVDMNRFLENDTKIQAYMTNEKSQAVDIPEDIPVVEKLMEKDQFAKEYLYS